jgi:hypothetical protein
MKGLRSGSRITSRQTGHSVLPCASRSFAMRPEAVSDSSLFGLRQDSLAARSGDPGWRPGSRRRRHVPCGWRHPGTGLCGASIGRRSPLVARIEENVGGAGAARSWASASECARSPSARLQPASAGRRRAFQMRLTAWMPEVYRTPRPYRLCRVPDIRRPAIVCYDAAPCSTAPTSSWRSGSCSSSPAGPGTCSGSDDSPLT